MIQKPFLLNPWKHHAGFLRHFIDVCRKERFEKSEFLDYLLKIGNSVIDLYFGDLGIRQIIDEVEAHLRSSDYYGREKYELFIQNSPGNFRNIKILDGSEWTLLIGIDENRYIHLHPARGSEFTVRVRATALKTALVLKVYFADDLQHQQPDLVDLTNEVRNNYLNESPIKNLTYTTGIRKVLDYL